jgi:hypothetical protein
MKGIPVMTEMNDGLPNADIRSAELKRRRLRSLAIALSLGFLVIMFYAATIVRLGSSVMERPI